MKKQNRTYWWLVTILILTISTFGCNEMMEDVSPTSEGQVQEYFESVEALKTLDGVYAEAELLNRLEAEARERETNLQYRSNDFCGFRSNWEESGLNPQWRDILINPTFLSEGVYTPKAYQNIYYFSLWGVALARNLQTNVLELVYLRDVPNLERTVVTANGFIPQLLRSVTAYEDLRGDVLVINASLETNCLDFKANWEMALPFGENQFRLGANAWEVQSTNQWRNQKNDFYNPQEARGFVLGETCGLFSMWLVPQCKTPFAVPCQGAHPTAGQIEAFERAAVNSATLYEGYSGFPRELYHEDINAWSYLGNLVQILEICGEKVPAIFTFDKDANGVKINHRIRVLGRDGSTTDYPLAGDGEIVSIGLQGQDNFFDVPLCGLPCTDTITSYRWFEVDTEDSYESAEWNALLDAAGKNGQCLWSGVWEGTYTYLFDGVSRRFQVTGDGVDLIGRMVMNPFDYNEHYIANMADDDGTLTEATEWTIDIVDHPLYSQGIQRIQLDSGDYFYPAVKNKNITRITSLVNLDESAFNNCP